MSVAIPRVSRTSLVDEVIGVLRKMLAEDAWSSGTKLPSELELARQLGVGRSTVREALRVLAHLGMVESRRGLGTYVVDQGMLQKGLEHLHSPDALRELYEYRRMLEMPAAQLAATRRTPEHMQAIRSAWRACEAAVRKDSADEFARLDFKFHLSIMHASHNRFLIEAYRRLERPFAEHVNHILALGPLQSMLHFHDGIILAIDRGDADAAARAVNDNFMEIEVRLGLLDDAPVHKSNHRRGRRLRASQNAMSGKGHRRAPA